MRRVREYLDMFIRVTVFSYYFNMNIPKNFLYLLIGLPVSMFSTFNGFLII